ncbi:MAG: TIGR03013 family XrtA/PEP-CTERM system glycosyltransferase [Acidiferrobacteraceae bacterium]
MIRIFRHYVPKALLFLAMIEALIIVSAIYAGVGLRFLGHRQAVAHLSPIFPKAAVFLMVMLAAMSALGLYQRHLHEGQWGYLPRLGMSFIVGLALMSILFYVMPSLFLGRGAFGLSLILALLGTGMARLCYIKLSKQPAVKRRVLVLGTGSRAAKINALENSTVATAGFRVVGYVSEDREDEGNLPCVLHDHIPLSQIVKKYGVQTVVIGVRDRRGNVPMNEILQCKLQGTEIVDLPTFLERESGRIELDTLNTSWLVFSDGFRQGQIKRWLKRGFDIWWAAIAFVLFLPVMALVALCIAAEDGWPVLYRQERVGQGGRTFSLIKFRSMGHDAERDGVPQWAVQNDQRVTRVGRLIRKIRLDEIPQVWNVLLGDMSFVGPRPERAFFVSQLEDRIPYYAYRHVVKPGITGWAQIRYPYGASVEDAIQKLQYEFYYIKNNTLFLDFVILIQTLQVLVWNQGAR